tara:strand:+ start:240 stop:1052 length:813 start_codon:yes stop_codon:yes gene_type:complete
MSKTLKLPVLGVKIDVSKPSWFKWLKIRRRQQWKGYGEDPVAMELLTSSHTHSLPLDEEVIKLKRLTALMSKDIAYLESFALAFADVGSLAELAKVDDEAKPEAKPEVEPEPEAREDNDHFEAAGSRLKLQKQHILYSSPVKALRFMADYANWAMARQTKHGVFTSDKQAAFSMETVLVQAFFKQRYPKSSDRTMRRTVRGYSHTLRQLKILKPITISLPGKNPQSIDMLIYCHNRKVRKWSADSIQAESVRAFEQRGVNKFDNSGGFQS